MKAKETQMLGILALIAVGIILLSMWGSEGEPDQVAMDRGGSGAQSVADESDLERLYRELLSPVSAEGGEAADPAEGEYTIELGPASTEQWPAPNEERIIRNVIEERPPQDISLNPPDPETEKEGDPAPEPRPTPTRTVVHIVQKGETLSAISQRYYGTSGRWKEILKANRDVLLDPRLLMPDMKLTIPAVANAAGQDRRSRTLSSQTADSADARVHTVRRGETLYKIAEKYYGDGGRWKQLRDANSSVVSDPQDLQAGIKLRVP